MSFEGKVKYEFGSFLLDPEDRAVSCKGELLQLAPKAFETLLVLVENAGRVVEKEELLHRIWPDTFVEENSLSQNISILRKALGEGSSGQQHIQTVPKRGYRFVTPVIILSPNDHPV